MRIIGLLFVFCLVFATVADANLLTNSSFENPVGSDEWTNSGWTISHGERKNWSPREGERSGMFWSWDDNTNGWAYQDTPVATGGTFVAGMWVRVETNLNMPTPASMSLEWYDATTNPVAPSNSMSYANIPPDGLWHHVHVKGTCTSSALAFVRAKMDSAGCQPPA